MDVSHRAPRNLLVPEDLRTLRCPRAAVPAIHFMNWRFSQPWLVASFGIKQRLAQRILTGQRAENQWPRVLLSGTSVTLSPARHREGLISDKGAERMQEAADRRRAVKGCLLDGRDTTAALKLVATGVTCARSSRPNPSVGGEGLSRPLAKQLLATDGC